MNIPHRFGIDEIDQVKPLIVNSPSELLLDTSCSTYVACKEAIQPFCELVKCPGDYHVYRLTPVSIWNACASGASSADVINVLNKYSRYVVPSDVERTVADWCRKYGSFHLGRRDDSLILTARDNLLMREVQFLPEVNSAMLKQLTPRSVEITSKMRGAVKLAILRFGYPVSDEAGYTEGAPLEIDFKPFAANGQPFRLRDYQERAALRFWADGKITGGCGVISMPCGSGKTIIGLRVMQLARTRTLIVVPSVVSARQWITEILDKTTLPPEDVGEYSGEAKRVRPVTVATYHAISAAYRSRLQSSGGPLKPGILNTEPWGLVIYDEVHMLPATMFRLSAELQSCRRLGLTGTLVREDGRELDVFSLIGPGRVDAHWKDLENEGWIARAECTEIRVSLPDDIQLAYIAANSRQKYGVAARNRAKMEVVQHLIDAHRDRSCLVLGQDLEQLADIASLLSAPLIDGSVSNTKRELLFNEFRNGVHPVLVVSRVGNTSIDLPQASVAIQVSGLFGSRQEEAQRLGRILRPLGTGNRAYFYSIVSDATVEAEFAEHRKLFLIEQGYRYTITRWREMREQSII